MQGKSFRLNTPTLGILAADGDGFRTPVTIPLHAVVTVDRPLDGNRLVDVIWEGKQLMMFTQDLRERGQPLD